MIERASAGVDGVLLGCDVNPEALRCARANVKAAGYAPSGKARTAYLPKDRRLLAGLRPEITVCVYPWDGRFLPLQSSSVDVLCSDLPFGHDVGSHDENLLLYPLLLKEAARVAKPGARGVFLTHEIRLMESTLNVSQEWELEEILPISINGLNPRIYCVKRA